MDSKIPPYPPLPRKKRLYIPLDSRSIIVVLLLIIIGMFIVWKPWVKQPQNTDRTVQVNGESSVKAEPDELTKLKQMPMVTSVEFTFRLRIPASPLIRFL
jgi:hypothetical protein